MTIAEGDELPNATLYEMGDDGPVQQTVHGLFAGKTVALFGLPGAFTPTCHNRHLPGFVARAKEFSERGVDDVICLSVNDPYVLDFWGRDAGAIQAGIRLIADPAAELVEAMGLTFDASERGLIRRCKRFSALVRDRKLEILNIESRSGQAEDSSADALLAQF